MRRLILLRHAKSSWADPGQRDFDRPLNPRGRRSAAAIGAWLEPRGYLPDAALVSSAVRTRQTWAGLGRDYADLPATFRDDLYHAEAPAMLRVLQSAPEDVRTLLMLGHQPGIGDFAVRLLPAPPADPDFLRYPTAAAAVIEFASIGWDEVSWGAGRLKAFITPRRLE